MRFILKRPRKMNFSEKLPEGKMYSQPIFELFKIQIVFLIWKTSGELLLCSML